jgi:rSAM/selenodomain-associated transferase 1
MNRTLHHIAIALFARRPVPGQVKTRLASDLGKEAACELYQVMVADIIANIAASALPLYLFHDGLDAVGLPEEWMAATDDVIRQKGDTLGERMTAAFEYLFSIGSERVILIGSDIPGIDAELLKSASEAIEGNDVVISPAFDGGYCLVALRKDSFNASMFGNIPWSTSRVLGATLDICTRDCLTYMLLDPRQDIDTLDDVRAYCRQPSTHAASTNNWLASHGYMEIPRNG